MTYKELVLGIHNFSFVDVMRCSAQVLTKEKRQAPWLGLSHGVKLLQNDDELAQYICAYGLMHKEKMDLALKSIEDPSVFCSKEITIIDWGCGQGLATICFLDYMHQLGVLPSIYKIILVEPSQVAINRAFLNLSKYVNSDILSVKCKFINDVTQDDIATKEGLVIHFFSNVLDILSVDLDHLYNIINSGICADQLFFCVGPQNMGASRINDFANLFNLEDNELINSHNGNLQTRGTINLLVFSRIGNENELVKVEYIPSRSMIDDEGILLQHIVKGIEPSDCLENNVLQFYKSVIDLERKKSSKILCPYAYPLQVENELSTGRCKFNIDIQADAEFADLFKKNLDTRITKWPQNLNIGIGVRIDNIVYRVFEYLYPYEELENIDITNQYISVYLSGFRISPNFAEQFGLDNSIVEIIENILLDNNFTIAKLEEVLKDAISNSLTIEHSLLLALSSEDAKLSQTQAEIKKLKNIGFSELLHRFLTGNIGNNEYDSIEPDTLLSVMPMDESQRKAISTALNSRISVITGPPGTGKTQMILNLLVNALYHDKRVLVASKNNKAVDNIKERYDAVDPYRYLLRFGAREKMNKTIIPYLDEMLLRIPNISFERESYDQEKKRYQYLVDEITKSNAELKEYINLEQELSVIESKLLSIKDNKLRLEAELASEQHRIEEEYGDIIIYLKDNMIDWNERHREFRREMLFLQSKSSGFKRMFFNVFQKRANTIRLLNRVVDLPISLSNKIESETGIRYANEAVNVDQLINLCNVVLIIIDRIIKYQSAISHLALDYSKILHNVQHEERTYSEKLRICEERFSFLKQNYESIKNKIIKCKEQISLIGESMFRNIVLSKLLSTSSTKKIAYYKNYLNNNTPWKNNEVAVYKQHASDFLDVFGLSCVTSLSVKNAYPLDKDIFDMVIIDEASQCDIASAIPLIERTRQLVVVGDPLQLRHISGINCSEERAIKEKLDICENSLVKYSDKSLWDYCSDLITTSPTLNHTVVLDKHYRCHPQIIGYSNEFFYGKYGINLSVNSEERHPEITEKGLVWIDVVGEQKSDVQNVNMKEIDKCIKLAVSLAQQYVTIRIGIITPFKHQAQELNRRLIDDFNGRIIADTVHKFQGDECDIIIYSLVVTDNSPESRIRWINYCQPNIVNVAVTRARTTLYVVGNRRYIQYHSKPSTPLGGLIAYIERDGLTTMGSRNFIIDSSIFIKCPDVIERVSQRGNVVLSAKVIDELDNLKMNLSGQDKNNVTMSVHNIRQQVDCGIARMEYAESQYIPTGIAAKNLNEVFLSIVMKYRNQNPIVLTSNNDLIIWAKKMGVRVMALDEFVTPINSMTIKDYIDKAIHEARTITIKYRKYEGEIMERKISRIAYSEEFGEEYISGYCYLRQDNRTFKISRIIDVDGMFASASCVPMIK